MPINNEVQPHYVHVFRWVGAFSAVFGDSSGFAMAGNERTGWGRINFIN